MSKELFNTLPTEIKDKVKGLLRAYKECNVTFEGGKFSVSTGTCLRAEYPKDYKFIGTINKDDIYTEVEQIENYINEFADYPSNYNGDRNYKELKRIVEERVYNHNDETMTQPVGRINKEGNFEITGTITISTKY